MRWTLIQFPEHIWLWAKPSDQWAHLILTTSYFNDRHPSLWPVSCCSSPCSVQHGSGFPEKAEAVSPGPGPLPSPCPQIVDKGPSKSISPRQEKLYLSKLEQCSCIKGERIDGGPPPRPFIAHTKYGVSSSENKPLGKAVLTETRN